LARKLLSNADSNVLSANLSGWEYALAAMIGPKIFSRYIHI